MLRVQKCQFGKNWAFSEARYSVLTREIKHTKHATRRELVEWIKEQQIDVNFLNKCIFTDAAHFHLNGFINRPKV